MLDLLTPISAVPGLQIRILAALIFTAVAAYYDIFNKKWVPNLLVYAFVAVALAINVIFFSQAVFISALVFGAVVFAVTYLLYRAGQLGAADSYVMAAIAICIPYLPQPLLGPSQLVPYPFILSVLVPTGIFFILHMLTRFIPYVSRQIAEGKVGFSAQKLLGPAVLAIALAVFLAALSSLPIPVPALFYAAIIFLSLSLIFFSLFKNEIKDSMVEMVPVAKLQTEDVIALEKMPPALVKKFSISPVIGNSTIANLKKAKVKSVPVYTGMPFFLPYLFLGLLVCVLFGDLLLYLV
jgi:Flp pilus assembly protein protease CpaA